jgi:hypothetical protein
LKDEIIRLKGFYAGKDCPYLLRRIEVWDEENEKVIVLLTNHLTFGPKPYQPYTRTGGR